MKLNKKLIEVALPLDAINAASVREKSIRHGHPSTLHLWWARRPLASARAVIFAQTVDDPSAYVDELLADRKACQIAERTVKERLRDWQPKKDNWDKAQAQGISEQVVPHPGSEPTIEDSLIDNERLRLFKIIEDLVIWENTSNQKVIDLAQAEIKKSWARTCRNNQDHPLAMELFNKDIMPGFHDPFAGGGALPLEAQRLGLQSFASDLNPIAVLINKAMIEIPPKYHGKPPVNSSIRKELTLMKKNWIGTQGLAEDVKYYGNWLREEAEKRLGHLFPKVKVTTEMLDKRPDLKKYLGKELTVIAWIWARTVNSPNPIYAHIQVPLAASFILSKKLGKEAFVQPIIENDSYRFDVRSGKPNDPEKTERGTKLSRGANFECIMSGFPISDSYIKGESMAGRMGERLIAIVAEGDNCRLYLSPTEEHEKIARLAKPNWKPEQKMNRDTTNLVSGRGYGFFTWADLFTSRQLSAMTTFSELVTKSRDLVIKDAQKAGFLDSESIDYANAISVYLAFIVSQEANHSSSFSGWNSPNAQMRAVFSRQAIPMVWDFAESNPFSNSSGSFNNLFERQLKGFEALGNGKIGSSTQSDAHTQTISKNKIISTDPPYYDNIAYADLSDFFYVWLRPILRPIYPDLFATISVPKDEELVATPYRHGSKQDAELFFLNGMTLAMKRLSEQSHPGFPTTIYYAFKQSETDVQNDTISTGWDTFLTAVIDAGYAITGTWPIRTEKEGRVIGNGTNALASSIVLVCRKREVSAPIATRRDLVLALKRELPIALKDLQAGNIAPVDLAQAVIGPGMSIFTRYGKVSDASGSSITVHQALALINQTLGEIFAEQEGDFDSDTRWALTWFEQYGFREAAYGEAENLAKAKNTSIGGLVEAGILKAAGGKVQLLHPDQYSLDWDPRTDGRTPVWQMTQQLAHANQAQGQKGGAALLALLGAQADAARELCYRLYTTCERKGWAADAGLYNMLVQNWRDMSQEASQITQSKQGPTQGTLI